MADAYIDNLEVLAYGLYASERRRSLSLGLDPDFDAVIVKVAARLDGVVAAVAASLDALNVLSKQVKDAKLESKQNFSRALSERRPKD